MRQIISEKLPSVVTYLVRQWPNQKEFNVSMLCPRIEPKCPHGEVFLYDNALAVYVLGDRDDHRKAVASAVGLLRGEK